MSLDKIVAIDNMLIDKYLEKFDRYTWFKNDLKLMDIKLFYKKQLILFEKELRKNISLEIKNHTTI